MPLVAITREMGSLGKDVAAGLGEALDIPVLYHEVIEPLADRMRVRKSHVKRLLDGSAGLFERLTADKTSLSIFSADEILSNALQGRGAVIRGWGATHLLREVPHAVCIRICAPLGVRRSRMLERLGTNEVEKVSAEIQQNDEAHTAIMRRHFSLQWTDSENYDLVLNTQRVSVAECVDEVLALVDSAEFAETDASRQQLEDVALAWRVRAALRLSSRTREAHVSVTARGGRALLAGVLDTIDERSAVNEVAASVQGVREIEDQLRTKDGLRPRFN
jgi:cytidylate kinase